VTHAVERWKTRLYDRRRGWVDGTTRFAALVRNRLRPDMRILDLGAGPGKPGRVNFRGEVASVVGVDPDWLLSLNEQVDVRVLAVAESLPFRSASFDLILADWVVEHLPDPGGMASEIQRVLKPGGGSSSGPGTSGTTATPSPPSPLTGFIGSWRIASGVSRVRAWTPIRPATG
jgi:ubiquinone/menaquinone biosynthesis C-methylase UbiE